MGNLFLNVMLLNAKQTLPITETPMLLEIVKIKIRLIYFVYVLKLIDLTYLIIHLTHTHKKIFFKWHNME